jgi:hypothetical protein
MRGKMDEKKGKEDLEAAVKVSVFYWFGAQFGTARIERFRRKDLLQVILTNPENLAIEKVDAVFKKYSKEEIISVVDETLKMFVIGGIVKKNSRAIYYVTESGLFYDIEIRPVLRKLLGY